MTQPAPEPADATPQPGKTRTWWHPLLVSLLRWQLGSHYRVEEEVPVGQMPLQIDIILIRKEQGELPAHARDMLAGLVERLGESTLIEFKGPSDTLRAGDLQTFLAYMLLYRAQNEPLLDRDQLHLVIIAPRRTKAFEDEMRALNITAQTDAAGVWRLQGGATVHPLWLLETEELAGLQHPLLTVMSPTFRRDRFAVYDTLSNVGYDDMMVYVVQQISQFHLSGKDFAMQHFGVNQEMHLALREVLKKLPLEDRLSTVEDLPAEVLLQRLLPEERMKGLPAEERMKGLPAEERMKGLPAEERMKGLPAEERLRGLTPEELDRLRLLLQQRAASEDGRTD